MPASEPLDVLLAHNLWATRQLLDACAALTPEQWYRRFEIGCGTLHDTLAHLVWAMHRWADFLAQREAVPPYDRKFTAGELREMFDRVAADFEALVRAHPLGQQVSGIRRGRQYTFTRGGVLTHVATHAMHHRAQALNMLRHLGVAALPPSSVLEWMVMVDNPQ